MTAIESLCRNAGFDIKKLSKEEIYILEHIFFIRLCKKLEEIFNLQFTGYFLENFMREDNLMCFVVNDILNSNEYSLEGISYYTQIPEEVICDLLIGKNPAPSLPLSRKIIELHKMVRPNLYRDLFKKISVELLKEFN